jgi:hypothetical protein
LVDQPVTIVFRQPTGGTFIIRFSLPAGMSSALTKLLLLNGPAWAAVRFAIRTAFAPDRHFVIYATIARAPIDIAVPSVLPITIKEIQAKLIIRLTSAAAPVRLTLPAALPVVVVRVMLPVLVVPAALPIPVVGAMLPIRVVPAALPIPVVEAMLPIRVVPAALPIPVVGAMLPIRVVPAALPILVVGAMLPIRVVPAALPIVVVGALPPRSVRFAIVAALIGITVSAALPIVVVGALPPRSVRFAIVAALIGITVSAALPLVVAHARPPLILPLPTEIGGAPRLLVLLIGRLDHSVEPFTDRHAGSARSLARSRARLRTETSEIPRTARFHSRVQGHIVRSRMCLLFRADAREQTTRRARFSVLRIEC